MRYHPLQLIANFSYLLTLVCGFALLIGLAITHSYTNSFLKNATVLSILYSAIMSWVYFQNYRNQLWAFKTLALMLAAIFIGMIIYGNNIDHAAHSSPVVTDRIFFYLQTLYFGTIVFAAVCLNAINFRSNVKLDKSTIPWTVNIAGLMMYIIGLTYCTRFSILYYFDIPLYKNSRFVVIFVLTTIALLTLQFFGKYGPLYRNRDGRQAFSTIAGYLLVVSIMHIVMPLPQFVADYFHYTPEQVQLTHWVARFFASIEVVACAIVITFMQFKLSKKYYRQFRQL